jgi:hypothetical protein
MLKACAPDPEIIAWLWSEEGLAWSKVYVKRVRHGAGAFAEIKNDHECHYLAMHCAFGHSAYPDEQIRDDIKLYGMNGVPMEWKRRFRRSE